MTEIEHLDGLAPYVLPGSPEEANWRHNNPGGWNKPSPSAPIQQIHSPEGHLAAQQGDVDRLADLARAKPKALHAKDANGWQPIHEAARAGHTDAIRLLVKHGADVNARTGRNGEGHSVLNLAAHFLDEGHELLYYLDSVGARDIEPEL